MSSLRVLIVMSLTKKNKIITRENKCFHWDCLLPEALRTADEHTPVDPSSHAQTASAHWMWGLVLQSWQPFLLCPHVLCTIGQWEIKWLQKQRKCAVCDTLLEGVYSIVSFQGLLNFLLKQEHTWYCHSIHIYLLDKIHQPKNLCYLCCCYIFTFPPEIGEKYGINRDD